ncbi:MAG: hypothetical protein WA996_15125 [Candidatus Promineifilaceae bacterium]
MLRRFIAGDAAGQAVNLSYGVAIEGQFLAAGNRPAELHHLFRPFEIKGLQPGRIHPAGQRAEAPDTLMKLGLAEQGDLDEELVPRGEVEEVVDRFQSIIW